MNKELIKKHKTEFDHWLNDGSIQTIFLGDTEPSWKESPDSELIFIFGNIKNLNLHMVINDEYVEFRKALAEGKIIQYHYIDLHTDEWRTMNHNMSFNALFNYQIKPEEPEFTYPMWFKSTTSELLVKFTSLTTCEIIIGTDFWDVGEITKMLKPHTNTKFWTQVPEPKKRIKVAKYRFLYQNHWEDSTRYYKSIEHFLLDVTGTTNITRLQETEIEVEDY